MIIDRTYFVGDLNIPNVGTPAIGELVDWFIAKYEPLFLRNVLGYELSKAFLAGLNEYMVDQKWTDLLEGVEYTDTQSKVRTWQGIVAEYPSLIGNQSPIANYVYYWFVQNNHSQTAAMGEVKSQNENAAAYNPGQKMVRAWNEMSKWIVELADYLNAKKDIYTEWEKQDEWRMLNKFRLINEFNI
jgi:hypothetical protein